MKDTPVMFADEFKQDCEILKDRQILDKECVDKIYSAALLQEEQSIPLIKKIITSIMTIVSSLLIGVSFLFLIFINKMVNNLDYNFIFFFVIFVYIVPGYILNFIKKRVIAMTLVFSGLVIITITQSIEIASTQYPLYLSSNFSLFCIISLVVYISFRSRPLKILVFLFFFTILSFFIIRNFDDFMDLSISLITMCYICMGINAVLFFPGFTLEKRFNPLVTKYHFIPLTYSAAFAFYFYFFFLTFINPEDSSFAYFIHNILYFIFTTGTVFFFFKYDIKFMKQIALVFFCAFIFFKYYDLVWLLLHKSLVLMIFGLLFIGLAIIFGLRWGVYKKHVQ